MKKKKILEPKDIRTKEQFLAWREEQLRLAKPSSDRTIDTEIGTMFICDAEDAKASDWGRESGASDAEALPSRQPVEDLDAPVQRAIIGGVAQTEMRVLTAEHRAGDAQ
jgi:hypothetical protein